MPTPLSLTTENFSIPYEWLPTYTETYAQEEQEIHATAIVNDTAEARQFFPVAILGDASCAAGGIITRLLPASHPTKSWLYGQECTLREGKGAWRVGAAGMVEFFANYPIKPEDGKLIYDITYRPVPYEVTNAIRTELDRYVERRYNISTETYQMPGDTFGYFNSENKFIQIPEPIAKLRPFIELHYNWHWVPEPIPMTAIRRCVGKVNKNPFDNASKQQNTAFQAGHLLCSPPEIGPRLYTPAGNRVRNIHYVFLYRPDTSWNDFFLKSMGDFVAVYHATGPGARSERPYKEAEFFDLFNCEGAPVAPEDGPPRSQRHSDDKLGTRQMENDLIQAGEDLMRRMREEGLGDIEGQDGDSVINPQPPS